VVNDALKTPVTAETSASARRIVQHFKRSVLATALLHEKQQQISVPEHQLVMEVST